MEIYLGIDVGSVTVKFAALSDADELLTGLYLPAAGRPVAIIQQGLGEIGRKLPSDVEIKGVATTGSARHLAGAIVGADIVKNEITCQAVAAVRAVPDVNTVIEIGGQDSKLIIIRDGMVEDFAMNTVCAAGTGSFLDHQAARLHMDIKEFSHRASAGRDKVHISGRCTVFAESDMVHKQQMGHSVDDIVYGLCRTLVRNYLSDVGSGKDIRPPVVFQGGVAFNQGIIRALREELKSEIIVPAHHELMGAIGAALLAHESTVRTPGTCRFRGFEISDAEYETSSFECRACPISCEIIRISQQGNVIASWGGQCDMWEAVAPEIKESR
ncbi:MAG: ATPase [Dehalococcoidales bacterium]|nr:ATPase [Dehalococcoidales bacterium]